MYVHTYIQYIEYTCAVYVCAVVCIGSSQSDEDSPAQRDHGQGAKGPPAAVFPER